MLPTGRKNHDRFLIIDDVVYVFGASLKDAGKKLFANASFIFNSSLFPQKPCKFQNYCLYLRREMCERMKRTSVVNQIKEQTHRWLPEAQTILYGSEARGDARPESDIDLLILLPEDRITPEREHAIVSKLFEIELQSGVIISSIVMSRRQWENPPVITPFYQNVKREGILL